METKDPITEFMDEETEWLSLTPAQRILETTKLWELYIALGGSLDPEPDTQSPFYVKQTRIFTNLHKIKDRDHEIYEISENKKKGL